MSHPLSRVHGHRPLRLSWRALATAALLHASLGGVLLPPGSGAAHAQSAAATTQFTVGNTRPEAYSWLWDNMDEGLLKAGNLLEVRSFRWLQAPATPQHLGYSTGAASETRAYFAGAVRTVTATYLDPGVMQGRVASDNHLGAKPYSFLAAHVSIDGRPPFTLLVQYHAVGHNHGDTRFRMEATNAADPALAQAFVNHLGRTLRGVAPKAMAALDRRYFDGVFKQRGTYAISPVDDKLNRTLRVTQEIRGITPAMLAWWWDHIGNTERYRLWQPIDHVSFEWTVPPHSPDLSYDIGAVQKVKEYIGRPALTLNITGADPRSSAPPVPLQENNYFYAHANPALLEGILQDNKLVHQWVPNAAGDGVVLTSTFVNTALAVVINPNFFHDLGSHALREFQMLPYFLPRLYRREHLGE